MKCIKDSFLKLYLYLLVVTEILDVFSSCWDLRRIIDFYFFGFIDFQVGVVEIFMFGVFRGVFFNDIFVW